MKLSKLLGHHVVLRNVEMGPHGNEGPMGCAITGSIYTSHELTIGESLRALADSASVEDDILVLHDADQDGNVAALVLDRFLKGRCHASVRYEERFHGFTFLECATEVAEEYESGYAVVVLDHSFNSYLYKTLTEHFKHVIWVDHHPVEDEHDCEVRLDHDTFFIFEAYSTANLALRMCKVAWPELANEVLVVEHVAYLTHFHDSWQYTKGDTSALSAFLAEDAKNLASWFDLDTDSRNILKTLFSSELETGKALAFLMDLCKIGHSITQTRGLVNRHVAEEFVGFITWKLGDVDYRIAYAMQSDARSLLGHTILQTYKDTVDASLVIFMAKDAGMVRMSLRGRPDGPPVKDICLRFGGGGHRDASGFSVPPSKLGDYLKDLVIE